MIELAREKQDILVDSLKRYMLNEFEIDMGDLKSQLLLDFLLQEMGPAIYNQAIEDAQAYSMEKMTDMEAVLWEPVSNYWEDNSKK